MSNPTAERTIPDRKGPHDQIHNEAHNVIKGIINDVIVPDVRKQLSDALARPRAEPPRTATHKAPDGKAFG